MTTTRRVFLKVLGATGAVSACGIPVLGCGPAPTNGGEGEGEGGEGEGEGEGAAALKSADVPDGLSFLAGESVILGKDGGGIYAMTSICTHFGCDITVSGAIVSNTEIDCHCHGSKYNADGSVQHGPAPNPLKHFKVTIAADDTLTVDTATVVDTATRA